MPDQPLKGWELLRSDVPAQFRRDLDKSVYGVSGLEDVEEWYLIDRLDASGLAWEWIVDAHEYVGSEVRKGKYGDQTWYLAVVRGTLYIERSSGSGQYNDEGRPTSGWRRFPGVSGHENRKLDAAFKGANTSAFKAANKPVQTLCLYRNGKMADFIVADDDAPPSAPRQQPPEQPPQRDVVLTDRQREAIKALLSAISDKAKQNEAKVDAWRVMQRDSVMAGIEWLIAWHRRQSGDDTAVVKMVLAMSGLWVDQEQRAA